MFPQNRNSYSFCTFTKKINATPITLMVITMLEVAILLMQLALLPQILSLVMTVLMIINDNNCENGNENDRNSNYINSSGKTNAIDDKKDECTMIVAKSLLEKKIMQNRYISSNNL